MRSSDYQFMFSAQEGKCAICKKVVVNKKRLDIDHDHTTGEVRGLLCSHCNMLLGHAYDDPAILDAAAKYLRDGGDDSRFYVKGGELISLK